MKTYNEQKNNSSLMQGYNFIKENFDKLTLPKVKLNSALNWFIETSFCGVFYFEQNNFNKIKIDFQTSTIKFTVRTGSGYAVPNETLIETQANSNEVNRFRIQNIPGTIKLFLNDELIYTSNYAFNFTMELEHLNFSDYHFTNQTVHPDIGFNLFLNKLDINGTKFLFNKETNLNLTSFDDENLTVLTQSPELNYIQSMFQEK